MLLSVKEIGYFASRLMVAAHCPPGAAPELGKVIVAQDLLSGGALEELIEMVDADSELLCELTLGSKGNSGYEVRRPGTPAFAVLPWLIGRLIADADRYGAANAHLDLGYRDRSWLEGILATRSATNLGILIAHTGESDTNAFLGLSGTVYRVTATEMDRVVDAFKLDPIEQLRPRQTKIYTFEVGDQSSPTIVTALEPMVQLSASKSRAFRDGRPMAPDTWHRLEKVISRTLVASSEKSRLGSG